MSVWLIISVDKSCLTNLVLACSFAAGDVKVIRDSPPDDAHSGGSVLKIPEPDGFRTGVAFGCLITLTERCLEQAMPVFVCQSFK